MNLYLRIETLAPITYRIFFEVGELFEHAIPYPTLPKVKRKRILELIISNYSRHWDRVEDAGSQSNGKHSQFTLVRMREE